MVGSIVVAFGNIEHAAVSLTVACTSHAFGRRVSSLNLQRRLGVLNALLHRSDIDAALVARWEAAYAVVDGLRSRYRNAIAHGAPVVDLYEDASGEVTFRLSYASPRAPAETLTLDQLQAAADQCEQAYLEMLATGTKILQHLARRKMLPLPEPSITAPRGDCARGEG